jgi:hypothetical protein
VISEDPERFAEYRRRTRDIVARADQTVATG